MPDVVDFAGWGLFLQVPVSSFFIKKRRAGSTEVDIRMCTSLLYLPERMCYKMDAPTIPGRDGHMVHAWKRGWYLATRPPYNRSNCTKK